MGNGLAGTLEIARMNGGDMEIRTGPGRQGGDAAGADDGEVGDEEGREPFF